MSTWVTVKDKDSTHLPQFDGETGDPEPSTELGIFKLRATYNRGLNSLHSSRDPSDAQSVESRNCFEEIVRSVHERIDQTAAARRECTLLLFLAYSNLSRMVAKTDEKGLALTYALNAANTLSIKESSFLDPGLLLRIAKLAFEEGDYWSCSHLLGYRISRENEVNDPENGGLLDSFYQLSEHLEEKLLSSSLHTTYTPFLAPEKLLISTSRNSSSDCLQDYTVFNSLATFLTSRNPQGAAEFSFFSQKSCIDVESLSHAPLSSDEILNALAEIPSDHDRSVEMILCDSLEVSDEAALQLDSTVTAAVAQSSMRRHTVELHRARSSSASSEPKVPGDNIANGLSRRKKEGVNNELLRNARYVSLKASTDEDVITSIS